MKRDSYSNQQAHASFQPRSPQPAIEPTQLGQPVHHSSSTGNLGANWLNKASGWVADKFQTAQNFITSINDSGDVIAPDQILPALRGTATSQSQTDSTNQPLVGVIDSGFGANEHGSKIVEAIQKENPQTELWRGGGVGTGGGLESLVEFVDVAKATGQSRAVANLSFDLTEVHPDGSVSTRTQLTAEEQSALAYARDNGVLVVASAGNQGGAMSALGQASQPSDNLIVVGAANGSDRASHSSYGKGLDLVADVGAAGTSLAAAKTTGAIAKLWSANPELSSQQVNQILTATATDLKAPGWDAETGEGLLNATGAIDLATRITPEPIVLSGAQLVQQVPFAGATWESRDGAVASERTNIPMEGNVPRAEPSTPRPNALDEEEARIGREAFALHRQMEVDFVNHTQSTPPPAPRSDVPDEARARAERAAGQQAFALHRQMEVDFVNHPQPTAAPDPTSGQVAIQQSDTLWDVAQEQLGSGDRWRELRKPDGSPFTEQEANRLQAGTSVQIPGTQPDPIPTPLPPAPATPPAPLPPAPEPSLTGDFFSDVASVVSDVVDNSAAWLEENGSTVSEVGHTILDVGGLIPVLGAAPDLINAGWHLLEGNGADAAASAFGALPFAGDAATTLRLGARYGDVVVGAIAPRVDEFVGRLGTAQDVAAVPDAVIGTVEGAADAVELSEQGDYIQAGQSLLNSVLSASEVRSGTNSFRTPSNSVDDGARPPSPAEPDRTSPSPELVTVSSETPPVNSPISPSLRSDDAAIEASYRPEVTSISSNPTSSLESPAIGSSPSPEPTASLSPELRSDTPVIEPLRDPNFTKADIPSRTIESREEPIPFDPANQIGTRTGGLGGVTQPNAGGTGNGNETLDNPPSSLLPAPQAGSPGNGGNISLQNSLTDSGSPSFSGSELADPNVSSPPVADNYDRQLVTVGARDLDQTSSSTERSTADSRNPELVAVGGGNGGARPPVPSTAAATPSATTRSDRADSPPAPQSGGSGGGNQPPQDPPIGGGDSPSASDSEPNDSNQPPSTNETSSNTSQGSYRNSQGRFARDPNSSGTAQTRDRKREFPDLFRSEQARIIASGKNGEKHPLDFLLNEGKLVKGVDAGHTMMNASGRREMLALEDMSLNRNSYQESQDLRRGEPRRKEAIEIGGVPVELNSAKKWENEGHLPKGTVEKALSRPGWTKHLRINERGVEVAEATGLFNEAQIKRLTEIADPHNAAAINWLSSIDRKLYRAYYQALMDSRPKVTKGRPDR